MLVGKIVKRDSGKSYEYTATGVDTSDCFRLRLKTDSYSSKYYMSNTYSEEDALALWDRRVDVSNSKVLVETNVYIAQDGAKRGKKVKASINTDLFCRLGALIQYVKSRCNTFTKIGLNDLVLASGEFEYNLTSNYEIPFEDSDDILARVTMTLGRIVSIELSTDDIDISLQSTEIISDEMFVKITDAVKIVFKLDEDYLGFPLKAKVFCSAASVGGIYKNLDEIIKNNPDKNFVWLKSRSETYKIVHDDELEDICNYIMSWSGKVAFDTETTGLNINFYSRLGKADVCVGVILAVKEGESFYFPLQMKYMDNLCGGDHCYVMERYLKPILETKSLIAFNASFDWKVGYIYNINCNIVDDVMSALSLTLKAENTDFPINLKDSTSLVLERDPLELSNLVVDDDWGESDVKFWDLPEELVKYYGCADGDNTLSMMNWVERTDLLGRYKARKVYWIEVRFAKCVGYQEFLGHLADVNEISTAREEIINDIDRAYANMVELAGYEFNPNSPPQLKRIIYEELKYPVQRNRKTGAITTGAKELNKLSELTDIDGNLVYPFVVYLLEYRKAEGVRKIVDSFPQFISDEGYMFSSVYQYGTTTGRLSIKTPAYQSYSDPVKKRIVARPGFTCFDFDYSSIETRIPASMLGDKTLIDRFENPRFDYHKYKASRMFNIVYEKVTKALRKAAKGVNFGIYYGMGDPSLGVSIFGVESTENTNKARLYRRRYFEDQKNLEPWLEGNRNNGIKNGYSETFFGRRRYYDRTKESESSIRRESGNHVVQGTAADIYKYAIGNLFERIVEEGWLGKVVFSAFVHDELFGEVSTDIDKAKFLKAVRESVELKINGWCPLYIGFGYGRTWYEAKSMDLSVDFQSYIIDNYGDIGFEKSYHNNDEFIHDLKKMERKFNIDDLRRRLQDESIQGKEIDLELNDSLISVITLDIKEDESLKMPNTTQGFIDLFCEVHNVSRDTINVLDITEIEDIDSVSTENSGYEDYDEDVDIYAVKERLINQRIDALGFYVDVEEKTITLMVCPAPYMSFIQGKSNTERRGYRIMFRDKNAINHETGETGVLYSCEAWLASDEIASVQQMYISYLRSLNQVQNVVS